MESQSRANVAAVQSPVVDSVARNATSAGLDLKYRVTPSSLSTRYSPRPPFLLAIRDGLPPGMLGHLNHHGRVQYLWKKQCERRTLRISKAFESKARSTFCDRQWGIFLRQRKLGGGCRQKRSS